MAWITVDIETKRPVIRFDEPPPRKATPREECLDGHRVFVLACGCRFVKIGDANDSRTNG